MKFFVTKTTKVVIDENAIYSMDRLTMRYKLTDSSGTILADTTNFPDDNDDALIDGFYFANNPTYYILYFPGYDQGKCSRSGELFIKTFNNDMQMNAKLNLDYEEHDSTILGSCGGQQEKIFPENGESFMTLDKI